jgi:hypothetical protein
MTSMGITYVSSMAVMMRMMVSGTHTMKHMTAMKVI